MTFIYSGRVYVRPCGRGLVMIDAPEGVHEDQIECAMEEGYYHFELRAVPLEGDEAKAAQKALR